jgi:hypothetical protein
MRLAILFSAILFALAGHSFAQMSGPPAPEPGPIQDNSFLAEEAYNQEPGVVQHIQTFTHLWNSKTSA